MARFRRFSKDVWTSFKQSFKAFGDIEPFNKSIINA